jgi:hypothetical protein
MTTVNEIDYEARVAKGITLLDKKVPDWLDIVDDETLDIRDGTLCVTAQIASHKFGIFSYIEGMGLLRLEEGNYLTGSYTEHGFNAETDDCPNMPPGYTQDDAYATLNAIWKREIAARRAASADNDGQESDRA